MNRSRIDFLMILGGFGSHLGSQNGAKMGSKIDEKIMDFGVAPGGALGANGEGGAKVCALVGFAPPRRKSLREGGH